MNAKIPNLSKKWAEERERLNYPVEEFNRRYIQSAQNVAQLNMKMRQLEKMLVYGHRLTGEIMNFLIKKKLMTSMEAFMITQTAKHATFTDDELVAMKQQDEVSLREQQQEQRR
jgi:hypothetical protein